MELSTGIRLGVVIIGAATLLSLFMFGFSPKGQSSGETKIAASAANWEEAEIVYKGYTPYGLSEADGDPILGIKYSNNIYYINTENTPEAENLSIGQKIEIEKQKDSSYLKIKEPKISTNIYCRVPVEDSDGKYCVLLSRYIESTHDRSRWFFKYYCEVVYEGVVYTYLIPENLYESLPCDKVVFYKNGRLNGYNVSYISKRKASEDEIYN